MKNSSNLTLLAIAVALSAVACKGNKSEYLADSTRVDSSVQGTKVDSTNDTSKMKTDTVSKTNTVAKKRRGRRAN
jgi:hypothetical protein